MIINIKSGMSGWSEYVLNGTKSNPRDKSKVEILDGDLELGDLLSKNNKYKESYYKIILALKGKPSDDLIKSVYLDFKREFFIGLEEEEYYIDAVVHRDTDDYHIHVRVPKQNIVTNTHLQLYYDSIDRKRKELIQDYISLKYGFEIAREANRSIFIEQNHEHIQKWREEYSQKPFLFSKKKDKQDIENKINTLISSLHQNNSIEKHEDIKAVLEELNLKVLRFGKDLKKDFSYVTVSNESGKMRIKGEIYNEEFWKSSKSSRKEQITSNLRNFTKDEINQRFVNTRKALNKENEKRYKKVEAHFLKARERAVKKQQEIESNSERLNVKKEEDEFSRAETRRRIENSRTETENVIRRTGEKRRLIYQAIESDIERQQTKQRDSLSKSEENIKSISGFERRFREYTESINDSTSRVSKFIGRINDYVKEIISRFKPREFLSNIVRRQR